MAIRQSRGTGFRQALEMSLDEAFAALAESLAGLTDEQFHAYPVPGRHNIVCIAEHCLQGLDLYGCEVQGVAPAIEAEQRFDIRSYSPDELRPRMVDLPSVAREIERVRAVHDAVLGTLAHLADDELHRPNPSSWWFEENPDRVRGDAFLRAAHHAMAHVRQIWFLRGAMGVSDATGWPEQIWA